MSRFDKFLAIRKAYADALPALLAEYDRSGEMRCDPYFMDWDFTPIEWSVWQDIRGMGLPFFPQMPVLNYFLDFGNPLLKIGIECDGKAWHDKAKDDTRDTRLIAAGWTIFRIQGHECKRVIDIDYERHTAREYDRDFDDARLDQFYMETSEGVMRAIKYRYFDNEWPPGEDRVIEATLLKHKSAPARSAA